MYRSRNTRRDEDRDTWSAAPSNKHNTQLPQFEMFYWCIVISYSQGSLLLTRSRTSFTGSSTIHPPSSSLTHSILFSLTRTLSCSLFVPLFLVHTLCYKTRTHTWSGPSSSLLKLYSASIILKTKLSSLGFPVLSLVSILLIYMWHEKLHLSLFIENCKLLFSKLHTEPINCPLVLSIVT